MRTVQLQRKALHLAATGTVALGACAAGQTGALLVCLALFVAIVGARAANVLYGLRRATPGSYGDLALPMGLAFAAVFALPTAPLHFFAALAVAGVADPLASLAGMQSRRAIFHVFGERRSVVGSGVFFLVSLTLMYAVLGQWSGDIILTALVLTVLEALSVRGSDNLTLPVAFVLLVR